MSGDGFTTSTVSLHDGLAAKAVLWPRSIAVRRGYSGATSTTAVVFVGELLGRIWRVDVDMSDALQEKITVERSVSMYLPVNLFFK